MKIKTRCTWAESSPLMQDYHDHEWGKPVHDDLVHFEFLVLEGAQAGLSWSTILKKREGYRMAFSKFDPCKVANFTDEKIEKLMHEPNIIRNRLKLNSVVINAKQFLQVQKEFGSFDAYCWRFVGGKPIVNNIASSKDVAVTSKESDAFSKDLKKRGFKFVGSTIMYSYMQATGMVNDHFQDCFVK